MRHTSFFLSIALLGLISASCFTVPSMSHADPDTNTIVADEGAVSAQVEEYLKTKGITVERINAIDQAVAQVADQMHETGQDAVDLLPVDDNIKLILLAALGYLFGKGGLKGSKGLFGRVAKWFSRKAQ